MCFTWFFDICVHSKQKYDHFAEVSFNLQKKKPLFVSFLDTHVVESLSKTDMKTSQFFLFNVEKIFVCYCCHAVDHFKKTTP